MTSVVASAAGSPVYQLRVGLGPVPASLEDVRREIGDRLDAFEPQWSDATADLELSLFVTASDVWGAVLSGMAAVTGTGYPAVRVDARPVERAPDRSPSRAGAARRSADRQVLVEPAGSLRGD